LEPPEAAVRFVRRIAEDLPCVPLSRDTPEGGTKRFFEYALSPAGQKIVATKFVAVH